MKKLLFMLAVLVSMLSPSVGWATTFIKEVAVSCNGKDPLKNNGYIVIDVDLNDGAGGRYIYAGYKTTTDASEAITDLIIRKGSEPDNHQFTWNKTGKLYKLATNPDGDNGNLNRGTGDKTPNYWLYYSKTGNTTDGESLVTSFYGHNGKSSSTEYLVGVSSANDDNPSGSQDLNQGAGGSYVYLGQKKEHTHSFSYWDYTTDNHRYGCASCGYVESTTAHNWSNSGAKIQDQTCTTAEVRYQTCTTCGRKNDANHTYIAVNALGHSFDEVNDSHHTNCTRCKHTFFRYHSKNNNVVEPANNNFGDAEIESNTYTNGEGVIEFKCKLTTIGNSAFDGCKGFTGDLVIPNSVTSIGDSAFYYCSGFKGKLVIPNSVTSIGEHAFHYCSGFTGDLVIPNSVTSIGNSAFYYCSGFTGDLVIPNSVTSIGEYAFYNCSGFNGKLVIPNSVTSIGISAFRDCSGFTGDLVIPNSVTSIGHYAFDNCSGFTGKLEIPNSVTSIGNNAFDNCSGFTGKLEIPNSVTCIESYAFYKCTGFTGDLVIPNSVTSIGHQAFYYCSGFTGDLVIPNSVTSIGKNAFYQCSGFTGDLVIPNTVTSIRDYAFEGCSGLKNVLFLGNKPMLMGIDVFSDDSLTLYVKDLSKWNTNEKYGAKSLTYKTWKEYCEEVIGHHDLDENCLCSFCNNKLHTFAAEDTHHDFCTQCKHGFFRYQSKEGQVVKPYSNNFGEAQIVSNTYAEGEGVIEFDRKLTTIGDYAFYYRSGLTGDLVIPNSVTSIGNYAFRYCTGLTGDLVIPNSVTSIGNDVFYKCSGFNGTLSIGNSVTSIGDNAFYDCFGFMGDLVIPNSVTSIGNYAFYCCYGFTGDLVIPNSVTSIGEGAFLNCACLTGNLVIPNSVTSIGNYAFYWCSGLQSVEIASLPLFGENAFYDVPCCISIALTDESYVCGRKDFYYSELPSLQSASYTRQMTNEWGTLVLPFGIDYLPENGNYRLYRLERVENQTLLLGEYAEGNIPAGTPVVVKAVGEKDSKGKYTLSIKQNAPTFDVNTETVECDNNGWCMKGTLEPMTAAADAQFDPEGKNVYYIAQNQFWYANQAFDMARFRAWFEAPATLDASAMRFQIMEVEETGIRTSAAGEKAESSFDLQGRRMSAPVKGLQIINGRKVLKK